MRKVVGANLRRRDLGRKRIMACMLRILSTCFMRAGSQVYADENGSYGLRRAAQARSGARNVILFDFPGAPNSSAHGVEIGQ
jgi:DNA topoisomerase-1